MRNFDSIMLSSVELFCLAVEKGSFTAAAHTAGLTPAAVSRSIQRLEKRLGIQLFQRSTRKINLSTAGSMYYEACRDALSRLSEAERQLTDLHQQPTGLIRLSLPTTYGHYRVLPLLAAFKQRYPFIDFDLHIGNHNIDFVEDQFDLVIRARETKQLNFVSRPLEHAALVVVASPNYLATHGTPQQIEDLEQHNCIQFYLPSTGQQVPWLFEQNGQTISLLTQGSYRCSDDILSTVTLARHAAGIVQTYRFLVEDDLATGRLVEILSPFVRHHRPFSVVYPANRHLSHRVRVFIDFLVEQLHLT